MTRPGGDELWCPAPRKAQPDERARAWGREDRASETVCQRFLRRGFWGGVGKGASWLLLRVGGGGPLLSLLEAGEAEVLGSGR